MKINYNGEKYKEKHEGRPLFWSICKLKENLINEKKSYENKTIQVV